MDSVLSNALSPVSLQLLPQSRQSAVLFLQSSELGLPQPLTRGRVCPPPPRFWVERHTRWRERGWESPNSDEGHTLLYSLYILYGCSPQLYTTVVPLFLFTPPPVPSPSPSPLYLSIHPRARERARGRTRLLPPSTPAITPQLSQNL